MLGAIIGDVVGSKFEFNNCIDKNFPLFGSDNFITDDTICTCAIADAICEYRNKHKQKRFTDLCATKLYNYGNKYKGYGYGAMFQKWLNSENPKPYQSYGNGAAMRASTIPYYAWSKEECKDLTTAATIITHDTKEAVLGTVVVNNIIWLALNHKENDIEVFIKKHYQLPSLNKIEFSEDIKDTVPICCSILLESNDFEDAIRKSIMIGGDSDTIANIVGAMAEPIFGIPKEIQDEFWSWNYLDDKLLEVYQDFLKTKI